MMRHAARSLSRLFANASSDFAGSSASAEAAVNSVNAMAVKREDMVPANAKDRRSLDLRHRMAIAAYGLKSSAGLELSRKIAWISRSVIRGSTGTCGTPIEKSERGTRLDMCESQR